MDPQSGRRAYRVLLALFPPSFRTKRGPEMARLYADMRAEWEEERGGVGPGFWIFLTWDAASQALAEWTSLLRGVNGPGTAHGRGDPIMTSLVNDVASAIRQLARQPFFSAAIVALMAVGIAGNAAVFRIFNGMFLRPLPFAEAERLVNVDVEAPRWNLEYASVAIGDYRAWTEENRTFEGLAAYTVAGADLVSDGAAERVEYVTATHTLDDVLRIQPTLGRFFTELEDSPDGPRVALLTAGFWERRFAADPDVIGQTLVLDGRPTEIIGVLPPAATFLGEADLWVPLQEDDQSSFYLVGIGRLRPGITAEQARDDLTTIHKAGIPESPVNEITTPVVSSLRDRYLGDSRLGSGFLLGAVAIVLLVACANIAGLTVARSMGRAQALSVRRALGASRSRIVRQLLAESLVLAALGGALGAWMGVRGAEPFLTLLENQVPAWVAFDLDAGFLAFLVLVTAVAAVGSGLLPALLASGGETAGLSRTRTTASARARRGLSILVGGQVALAAALLAVAGLAVADVRALANQDPGFRSDDLMTFRVQPSLLRYPEAEDRRAFVAAYLDGLRALPGIETASLASNLPLMGHSGWFFEVERAPERDEDEGNPVVLRRWVTPGYFETLGVTLRAGRGFDDFDGREDGTRVAVVNESFVRSHLQPGTDPLGQRIRTSDESPWITIVGVNRDVKHYGPDRPMRPGIYEPMRQFSGSFLQVAVRVPGDEAAALSAVRRMTAEIDPGLSVHDVRAMDDRLDAALATRRATSWLIGIFSAVAVALAVSGLYGVITYSVGQRRREIGIRMALGAAAATVRRSVLRQGMAIAGMGMALGLLAAWAASGVVSGILVGVSATDPLIYGGVTATLAAVAAFANWLPARRAAATDPMTSLRSE